MTIMNRVFLVIVGLFCVASVQSKVPLNKEYLTPEIKQLLNRTMGADTSFKLGNWNINYPKSYVTLYDLEISTPKPKDSSKVNSMVKASVGKVIGDYLYFDHAKDNAYYSIRVEKVGAVIDTTSDEERTEPEKKIKVDKLRPPIDNILKELFITKVELLLRDLRQKNEVAIPLVLNDILIKNLEILPSGRNELRYADISATGEIFDGVISLKGRMNPFHNPKVLDVDLKIENVSIVKLNPYLKKLGGVDATSGKLSVYFESAVKGEMVEGYIKFVTKDAEMIKGWQEGQGFLKNLKENFLDLGFRLFNRKDDDDLVAGKIPFSGRVTQIKWDYWALFETLLKSALVEPLKGDVEKSVDLETL